MHPSTARTPLLVGVLVLASLNLGATSATHEAIADAQHSANMEFVTNVAFQSRSDSPTASRRSVDMDFHTYTFATSALPPTAADPAKRRRPPDAKGPKGGTVVERDFAFVGTYVNGLQVVDITEPTDPQVVAVYDCAIAQADVNLFERPDLGRVFVAYTSDTIANQTVFSSRCHVDNGVQSGEFGTFLIDVTDPFNPVSVSFTPFPRGTHQATIHPTGRWLYSSPASLTTVPGALHVADIGDPWNPGPATALDLLSGADAHDLAFNEDGTRAYVAALTHSLILDTTEPGDPEVIARIVDPTINIDHEAHPISAEHPVLGERDFLVIGDEFGGAAGNEVCPGGGLHVFDITGDLERNPVKVGAFFIPDLGVAEGAGQGTAATRRCTAHVMQVHPEEQLIVMGWYAAGVRVLDVSGLVGASAGVAPDVGSIGAGIREIGYFTFDDDDVWAAKTNRIDEDGSFFVYAADTNRMLDVIRFTGAADPSQPAGEWLSPTEVLALAPASSAPTVARLTCLIG